MRCRQQKSLLCRDRKTRSPVLRRIALNIAKAAGTAEAVRPIAVAASFSNRSSFVPECCQFATSFAWGAG